MENNKNNIDLSTLTPSEIEMLRIEREKKALAEQEQKIKQQAENERKIKREQEALQSATAMWEQQNIAARKYFGELQAIDSRFILTEHPRTKSFEAYDGWGDDRKVLWSEELNYTEIRIEHPLVPNKTIYVEEHETKSDRYPYKRTSHGFKMKMGYDHRMTKDPKNMALKFTSIIAKAERESKEAKRKLNAQEQTLAYLQQQYPTAKIEHQKDYRSGHNYGNRHRTEGYYVNYFTVIFENGFGINVGYDMSGGDKHDQLRIYFNSMIQPNIQSDLLTGKTIHNLINALQTITVVKKDQE